MAGLGSLALLGILFDKKVIDLIVPSIRCDNWPHLDFASVSPTLFFIYSHLAYAILCQLFLLAQLSRLASAYFVINYLLCLTVLSLGYCRQAIVRRTSLLPESCLSYLRRWPPGPYLGCSLDNGGNQANSCWWSLVSKLADYVPSRWHGYFLDFR